MSIYLYYLGGNAILIRATNTYKATKNISMIRPYSCFSYLLENTKWAIENRQFRDTDTAFMGMSYRVSVFSETGTVYHSITPGSTTGFCGIRVAHLFKVVFGFVFFLYLVPNVTWIAGLSILDCLSVYYITFI